MEIKDVHLKPIPAQAAVLLIFMPPEQYERSQRASVQSLADSLQQGLGDQMRVIKIEKLTQMDVFRSFEVSRTPAFVLIRQGIELWRQIGMVDEDLLTLLPKRLSTD